MPGVYVSYPFCSQKCTFCNFASGVQPRDLEVRYLDALRHELRTAKWDWTPETLYFGGGTPSNLDPATLAELIALVPHAETLQEVTLEAAPGNITPERAEAWRSAGVNRVSLGVQSFVTRELARTGRKHTAEIVAREVATLRTAGIDNINVDLIAGLPGQTEASWRESLAWIERLAPPHVSIYMLEVDEDSRLGAEVIAFGQRYGARDLPSDDAMADFYEIAVDALAAQGIARYEISNFARQGSESRHNLKYWLREPYQGFGADAHGFDGQRRYANAETAAAYVDGGSATASDAEPRSERFFLGLRLLRGIEPPFAPFESQIARAIGDGLLEMVLGRLRLTRRGVLLSNEVFAEFLP
jgi:oxygen-independent coproporphyrinogen III oxidase